MVRGIDRYSGVSNQAQNELNRERTIGIRSARRTLGNLDMGGRQKIMKKA